MLSVTSARVARRKATRRHERWAPCDGSGRTYFGTRENWRVVEEQPRRAGAVSKRAETGEEAEQSLRNADFCIEDSGKSESRAFPGQSQAEISKDL